MRSELTTRLLLLALCLLLPFVSPRAQVPAASADNAPAAAQAAVAVLARARQLYAGQGAREALPEFEKALTLFRQEGDRKGEAVTLGLIGNCHKRLGDFTKALDYLRRALSLKRELGDRAEEGKTLSHLGLLH